MKEFIESEEVSTFLDKLYKKGITVGFVPTMGALHKGHLALVEKAKRENDKVVCSIFVNPLQFNNASDFDSYPNTIKNDIDLLKEVGCDFVFLPKKEDLFRHQQTEDYDFGQLGEVMEAVYRPGHFEGVATVVKRFLEVLKPTKAYFGEKDYQQLAIVRWLVKEFSLSTNIVACSTVRERSGLALSSRNLLLSNEQKSKAFLVYEALQFCKSQCKKLSPKELMDQCRAMLAKEFEVEYFVIADELTFNPINDWQDSDSPRAFTVVYSGEVRLIDNLSLID